MGRESGATDPGEGGKKKGDNDADEPDWMMEMKMEMKVTATPTFPVEMKVTATPRVSAGWSARWR